MSRKAFLVQVELDVQAVTCPGVWLCSNGKVSLQIYMLDSCVQTGCYKPLFPVQCNETFVFYKTFYNKHRLKDLENELHNEWIYIELVQWQDCQFGQVLASFQTTLDELLYPSTRYGSIAGVDLDLLMDAKKTFPGLIAPKTEISTRTTIEEILCDCIDKKNLTSSSTVVVNPKVLVSHQTHEKCKPIMRKVCHSIAYRQRNRADFRNRQNNKPPFRYRKAEDDLILRKPKLAQSGSYDKKGSRRNCKCHQRRVESPQKKCQQKPRCSCLGYVQMCSCGSGHREDACPVCAKYKGCFNENKTESENEQVKISSPAPRHRMRSTLYNSHRSTNPKMADCMCRPMAYPTTAITDDSSENEFDCNENCFCFPSLNKPTLAEKLHDKLKTTLSTVPSECSCFCKDNDLNEECDNCCHCVGGNFKSFYKNCYRKARQSFDCVPECPAYINK